MYFVWNLSVLVVRTLAANVYVSRMSHMALDLRTSTSAPICKVIRASSIACLLKAIHFRVLTSFVNREVVFEATAPITEVIGNSS